MRNHFLILLFSLFSVLTMAQNIASLQLLTCTSTSVQVQEKSLCSFEEDEVNYQLKLERSGFQLEEWLPMLEIFDNESQKTKSVLINIGAGNHGERVSLAAAKYQNGFIYFVGIGNIAIGKYFFYSGKISKDGQLSGKLKEIEVPFNTPRNKGIPFVVPGNFGTSKSQFTLLLFLPGENLTELSNLKFTNVHNPEIGMVVLSDKMEPVQDRKIKFDMKAEEFTIQNCILSNEGDILFITNNGQEKKSTTTLFHTHVYKLNELNKENLTHHPKYNKQLVVAENPNVIAFAFCDQENATDKPTIRVQVFEKGGFTLKRELTIMADRNELSLARNERNFDLKKIELTNSGILLLGAFYELKSQKVKEGQAQLPNQKLENYYLLIHQEVNGNATLQAIPVFTELGPYSPSYQIHNQKLHLLFNGHVKNSFVEGEKPIMLFNKDVSKKAQLVASTLQVSNGKINYQVLSTSQEKIRFLSASAQQKGNVFFVDVIEKSSANEFRKNIVKTAAINFIL